jgi:hypothetical protein
MIDGSGQRWAVWNGNSLHAVPKPDDRLQATTPKLREAAVGSIAFDVPEGVLKLGYTLSERSVIYWTPMS